MQTQDFQKQMAGYGLTTAQIFYRLPDYPDIITFLVWQEYDLCPKFPELSKFLSFWRKEIEGPLHSVKVTHSGLLKPAEMRAIGGEFRLN